MFERRLRFSPRAAKPSWIPGKSRQAHNAYHLGGASRKTEGRQFLYGMTEDHLKMTECWAARNIPARINAEKTATLLGFSADDLTVLMAAGHLQPLGKPAPNAPKYFHAIEIMSLAADRAWLDKATKIISQYWLKKRQRQKDDQSRASVGHSSGSAGTGTT